MPTTAFFAAPSDAYAAILSPPLAAEPPAVIQLLPVPGAGGEIRGADGRRWTMRDTAAVLARSRELADTTGGLWPIDYDHQIDRCEDNGGGAPASGWMTALEARDDGSIWARVEWTPAAAQRIKDREYRFLSPVFYHGKDGEVLAIARAGLTNDPNLTLKALASRQCADALTTTQQEARVATETQNENRSLLDRLAEALGAAKGSDEAALVARCTQLVTNEAEQRGRVERVAGALKVQATATADEFVAACNSRGAGDAQPDPTKFVPMSAFLELQETIKQTQAGAKESAADVAVNSAVAAGKVTPAQRAWALAYASKDLAGFEAYAANAPRVVAGDDSGTPAANARGPRAEHAEMDAEDTAVCARLDLDPEQYKKNIVK